MDELDDVRKVRLTKKLMDEMASRDLSGNRVIWSWGEPDGEGFYSPSATLDLSDNLAEVAAQQERERIKKMAVCPDGDMCIEDHVYLGFHDYPFGSDD